MKAIKNILLLIGLALFPAMGSAQTHLKQAASNFIDDRTMSEYFSNNDDESGDGYYYKIRNFSIPKEKTKMLDQLIEAYNKDSGQAYSYYKHKKGGSTQGYKSIAYGKDNDSRISFGTKADRNYRVMFFDDPKNEKKRTVYALTWYEHGENIDGWLYLIYGDNPQKTKKSDTFYDTVLNSDIVNYGEQADPTNSQIVISDSIKTSEEFLSRFGNYRTLFNNFCKFHKSEILQSSIVSKMLKLCKQSGHLLDADEKKIIINSIKDMQTTYCTDSYQKELLGLALKYLK